MKVFKVFLSFIFCLAFLAFVILGIVKDVNANMGYKDYLKLAADAPTVQKSYDFLNKALNYIEENDMTKGSAAIFIKKPSRDIGVWYGQIKGARDTLSEIIKKEDQASQLEKDNALMKVREVLTDDGGDGIRVTIPTGLVLYPLFAWYWWILLAIGVLAIIVICWTANTWYD